MHCGKGKEQVFDAGGTEEEERVCKAQTRIRGGGGIRGAASAAAAAADM